jgi:hypothetical protein
VQPLAVREGAGIYLASLDGKENRRLLTDVSRVIFSPAPGDISESRGYLLFVRESTLMAQPFDTLKFQLSGDVFPIAEGVASPNGIYAPISASDNGILLYGTATGNASRSQIAWYDRAGKVLGPAVEEGNVLDPALSPVFTRVNGVSRRIWLKDLVRGTDRPLTSGADQNLQAVWSPKGDRIAYRVNRGGVPGDIYEEPVEWLGARGAAAHDSEGQSPNQWSRDGRFIVYYELSGTTTQRDVWVLPVDDHGKASGKPMPFV